MAKAKRVSFNTAAPGKRKSKAKNLAKAGISADKSKLIMEIQLVGMPIVEDKLTSLSGKVSELTEQMKNLESRIDAARRSSV